MMVEVFRVLLKNAIEAIAEKGGAGQLRVATSSTAQAISIAITDNGVGIKPEHLSRIFELRWSTKRGAGLGFGLFWVRDYIEGLGGTISVKSVYGEGATFVVTIPIP
jgi:signal transduction histidine kinase